MGTYIGIHDYFVVLKNCHVVQKIPIKFAVSFGIAEGNEKNESTYFMKLYPKLSKGFYRCFQKSQRKHHSPLPNVEHGEILSSQLATDS